MEGRHPTLASNDRFNSATNPAAVQSIADLWIICALAERDAAAANNALIASGENPIGLASENVFFNRPFVEGVIARMTKDDAKSAICFHCCPHGTGKKSSKPSQIIVPRSAS